MQHTYRSIRLHSWAVTFACRSFPLLLTDERQQHCAAETDILQLKAFLFSLSLSFSFILFCALSLPLSWCVAPIRVGLACPCNSFAMLLNEERGVRLTDHLKKDVAFWVLAQVCILLD